MTKLARQRGVFEHLKEQCFKVTKNVSLKIGKITLLLAYSDVDLWLNLLIEAIKLFKTSKLNQVLLFAN